MKKFLIVLVAVIGLVISANAQNKITFYKGNQHITLYQNGSVGYWDGNKNYDGQWSNTGPMYSPTTDSRYMGEKLQVSVVDSQSGDLLKWEGGIYYFDVNTWKALSGFGQVPGLKLGNDYFTRK